MNKPRPLHNCSRPRPPLKKQLRASCCGLHARLQKYNVIIKIIIYHDAVR